MKKAMTKIKGMIHEIRGQKVMLDSELAELYGVELRTLNQAVKRNIERFPKDFMFQLKKTEWDILRSQIVISKNNQGGRRYVPYVFTEQGIAMLSGILNSGIAVKVNIQIMRAFVQLRHYVLDQDAHKQIAELRNLLLLYMEKNDRRVNEIIMALNSLLTQPVQQVKTKRIGFNAADDKWGNYK